MNRPISKKEFKKEVIENRNLTLVHFKIEWSGACQIIDPIYEDLARSYQGQADFFQVDIEQQQDLEKEYGILEVPTILFFSSGQVIDHTTGLIPRNILIHKIEKALNNLP